MDDFKSRLIAEQTQLIEKLDKLDAFLMSESSKNIDNIQLSLLKIQATAMNTYNQCLLERLDRL